MLADGSVKVDTTLDADSSLPGLCVGMSTKVNRDLASMAFYGKGPFENYIDHR